MELEWDQDKCKVNIQKHGIDFQTLASVFEKPTLAKIDNRLDYQETRMIALGELKDTVIVFVYVKKSEKIIRIISARKATKNESKTYYQKIYETGKD